MLSMLLLCALAASTAADSTGAVTGTPPSPGLPPVLFSNNSRSAFCSTPSLKSNPQHYRVLAAQGIVVLSWLLITTKAVCRRSSVRIIVNIDGRATTRHAEVGKQGFHHKYRGGVELEYIYIRARVTHA